MSQRLRNWHMSNPDPVSGYYSRESAFIFPDLRLTQPGVSSASVLANHSVAFEEEFPYDDTRLRPVAFAT